MVVRQHLSETCFDEYTLTLSVAERIICSSIISKEEQLYHKQPGLFSISFHLKIRTCNVVTYSYDNIF